MSHFTLTVCLNDDGLPELSRAARIGAAVLQSGIENRLKTALGRFDEHKEMEPYRSYEKGTPAEYWAVGLFRKENGLNPDDATLTWAQIAEVHNKRWPDPEADDATMLVDEDGRAYSMSTYNPDSKWDWYSVGGRWAGRFVFRPGHKDLVIHGERSWTNENEVVMPQHCDGGQKRALNLGAMRDEAAAKAKQDYAKYLAVTAGTPDALPWSTFTDNASAGNGYTIDRAREEYHSQPRIAALGRSEEFLFADNEDYACGEKLFIERARARAVPGFALLTTDGRWFAPGEMGWFGASSDTEGSRINYWEVANAYIEALPDDAWLVSVDCHI